jgi:hypothetical protein
LDSRKGNCMMDAYRHRGTVLIKKPISWRRGANAPIWMAERPAQLAKIIA